jgi:hypothetical protein
LSKEDSWGRAAKLVADLDAVASAARTPQQRDEHVTQSSTHPTDTEELARLAARAFGEIFTAAYGHEPESTQVCCDGDAILLIFRVGSAADEAAEPFAPPLSAMARIVSSAVAQRTGETLRAGGHTSEPDRGLAVLSFERMRPAPAPSAPVMRARRGD